MAGIVARYALDAERKMGEMLEVTERAVANQYTKSAESIGTTEQKPTLKELGIGKDESSKAQQLASLPVSVFEEVKAGTKTRTQARREYKRATTESSQAQAVVAGLLSLFNSLHDSPGFSVLAMQVSPRQFRRLFLSASKEDRSAPPRPSCNASEYRCFEQSTAQADAIL